MRKFTKAAAMLCAAAMVIPSASVFAAEDGGASELTEVGTYPISEEPLEFTMFRTNMPNVEDFQTNDFTKYMEDLTNIKFTFEAAARDDRAEKLNMEFNTNTYPDVIMHYAPDAAKWGVEEGILIPRPCGGIHSRMVRQGLDAVGDEQFSQLLDLLAAETVDDARLPFVLFDILDNFAGDVDFRTYLVKQIGTVE